MLKCSNMIHWNHLLEAFEVTLASTEMLELVAYARQGCTMAINANPSLLDSSYKPRRLELRHRHKCCEINQHSNGQLFASFSRPAPRALLLQPNHADFSLYPWRDGKLPEYARPVYSGSSLAALVCAKAKKGDILVRGSDVRPDCLLVLRLMDDEEYSTVGQALCVNGFNITADDLYRHATIELNLTAPEVLLLWTQDFLGVDSYSYYGQATYDPDMQLQRLWTAVVLEPDPLSRATVHFNKRV